MAKQQAKPLQPPHSLSLQAAEGWMELGNAAEAKSEVLKIPVRFRSHPDVLEVHWHICARLGQWEVCLDLARTLTRKAPGRVSGWVNLSFALHELKMTIEAWDNLFAVAARFPSEPTIPYNLACYGAELGRLWEAERWLKQAFKLGKAEELKRLALADSDLKPLWDRIEQL